MGVEIFVPLKAESPIDVTLLGIMIEVKPEQNANDSLPIDVTVFGIVIEVILFLPSKAKSPICVIPILLGITTAPPVPVYPVKTPPLTVKSLFPAANDWMLCADNSNTNTIVIQKNRFIFFIPSTPKINFINCKIEYHYGLYVRFFLRITIIFYNKYTVNMKTNCSLQIAIIISTG